MISHDPHIDRIAIRTIYNPDLPTLDDVLSLSVAGTFHFDIEIKSFPDQPGLTPAPERFAELVLSAVRRCRVESRVNILSFDFRTLHAMHRIAPEIRCSALYEGAPKDFVEISREAGNTPIVSPHYSLVTPEQVAAAHAQKIQVFTWTANTPADWDKLIAAKVDAIITDDPAALIDYLALPR